MIQIMIPPDGDARGMNLPEFLFEKDGKYKISPEERARVWEQMMAECKKCKKIRKK